MQADLIRKLLGGSAAAAAALMLSGCNLVKDETDCVSSYNMIRFVYEHNMKFTCAFANEVDAVTVLAFDSKTGVLAKRVDALRSHLVNSNEMPLDVAPGDYDILVWAGEHQKSYDIQEGIVGVTTLDDFDCYMRRQAEADGAHVREDIAGLYHGKVSVTLPWASPSKPNYVTVPLMKNTNTFRLVLQHVNGDAVNCDDFEYQITDRNGWMNADNSLRDDETLTYHPWYTFSGSVDINTNPTDAPGNRQQAPAWANTEATRAALGASLCEFTTGRLMTHNNPVLTVRNKATQKTVFSIPVNDYALLVKGFYHRDLEDQEYLDRQDEYNMTFFLDDGNRWLNTVIIINDWRIVRHETPVE